MGTQEGIQKGYEKYYCWITFQQIFIIIWNIRFSKVEYISNIQEMRFVKKISNEPPGRRKIYEKISNYLENQEKANEEYCQSLEEYINTYNINVCFKNLHQYLNKNMIRQVAKNVFLEEGIHILLEGSLIYVWTKHKNDRDRKYHLFSMASTGNFSHLVQSYSERENLLTNGYSILINSPFAVVQSEGNNICANEDCIMLCIPKKIVELTDFSKLAEERKEIFSTAKLPGIKHFTPQPLIGLNFSLHHTFKTRRMNFRSKFNTPCLAIITKGSARAKMSTQNVQQFSERCILLPNFQFEVSSAQIEILEVIKNPTLIFKNPLLVQKFKENLKKVSENEEELDKATLTKYRSKISNSISMYKECKQEKLSQKEQRRKRREFGSFSKECEHFCIVPLEFCEVNLNLIRNHKKKNIFQAQNKTTHVLFNYQKKQNLFEPIRKNSEVDDHLTFRTNKNYLTKNELMDKYERYAKDLYTEFKKYQQKNLLRENLRNKEGTKTRIL